MSLDVIHARVRRSASQGTLEPLQFGVRPFRNNFNRTVGQVLREAAELQPFGFMHDKPPEPDPLNAPPDNPAAAAQTDEAFRRRRRRYTNTPMMLIGISARIAHVT